MSIKGSFKTLYVGKERSTIEHFWGNRQKIIYENLTCIEYSFAGHGEVGYLNFIYPNAKTIRFNFGKRVNGKILKTINLIQENNPELQIIEHTSQELKFYQRNLFIVFLMFFCCAPIGLFLMWYYRKHSKPAMIAITMFFVAIWGSGLFVSYNYYTSTMNQLSNVLEVYNSRAEQLLYDASSTADTDISDESLEKQAFSTTLTAGHYLVGTDIPVGTYSFFSKKGSGNLFSSDGSVNAIFDHGNAAGESIDLESFGTEELKNIYLNDGIILTVTGPQHISAGCDDGFVDSMKDRVQEGLQDIEIGYGHYGVTDDIPAGTYDIEWLEGNGNIICMSSMDKGINEIIGEAPEGDLFSNLSDMMYIKSFKNLTLEIGDVLEIDDIKVRLKPSK